MNTHSSIRCLGLVWTALLLCVTACQKSPSLTLKSASDLVIEAKGGSATVTFTTNTDWTVRSDSWIHVSPASGAASKQSVSVTVTADANTTSGDRNGKLTIVAGELSQAVTVSQEAVYFRISSDDRENPSVIILDREGRGGTAASLKVDSNVGTDPAAWSVTCSEAWCHAEINANAGFYKYIMISADAYGTSSDSFWPRTCDVRIQVPGFYSGTVRVVQESRPYINTTTEHYACFTLSPAGAVREIPVYTNLYDWQIENGNDWVKAEKADRMTLRLSVVPRTDAAAPAREGTIYLYSSALAERPAIGSPGLLTLVFKEGDPDVSGEDYGYGEDHGWD